MDRLNLDDQSTMDLIVRYTEMMIGMQVYMLKILRDQQHINNYVNQVTRWWLFA